MVTAFAQTHKNYTQVRGQASSKGGSRGSTIAKTSSILRESLTILRENPFIILLLHFRETYENGRGNLIQEKMKNPYQ